jgi:hypothetical protein
VIDSKASSKGSDTDDSLIVLVEVLGNDGRSGIVEASSCIKAAVQKAGRKYIRSLANVSTGSLLDVLRTRVPMHPTPTTPAQVPTVYLTLERLAGL